MTPPKPREGDGERGASSDPAAFPVPLVRIGDTPAQVRAFLTAIWRDPSLRWIAEHAQDKARA